MNVTRSRVSLVANMDRHQRCMKMNERDLRHIKKELIAYI